MRSPGGCAGASAAGTGTEFPLTQKFFAVGEALAHLDYLEARGQVYCRETAGKRVYFAGAGDKI